VMNRARFPASFCPSLQTAARLLCSGPTYTHTYIHYYIRTYIHPCCCCVLWSCVSLLVDRQIGNRVLTGRVLCCCLCPCGFGGVRFGGHGGSGTCSFVEVDLAQSWRGHDHRGTRFRVLTELGDTAVIVRAVVVWQ
jgi:hypothetical protein